MGCLWTIDLKLVALCDLIVDRVRLIQFLLHRKNAKTVVIDVLKLLLTTQYNSTLLPTIEKIFDELNEIYA